MIVACGALVAGKEGSAGIETCSCCALSNTNSMWMTLILNLGLLSEKPATNHLSYCMAVKIPRGLNFKLVLKNTVLFEVQLFNLQMLTGVLTISSYS